MVQNECHHDYDQDHPQETDRDLCTIRQRDLEDTAEPATLSSGCRPWNTKSFWENVPTAWQRIPCCLRRSGTNISWSVINDYDSCHLQFEELVLSWSVKHLKAEGHDVDFRNPLCGGCGLHWIDSNLPLPFLWTMLYICTFFITACCLDKIRIMAWKRIELIAERILALNTI